MFPLVVCGTLTFLTSDYNAEYDIPASAFRSSALVLVDFKSPDPCWFDLRSGTGECGGNSPPFTLSPQQRHQSESKTTIGLRSSTSTSAASASTEQSSGASNLPNDDAPDGDLSPGVKAGIALSVIGACLILLGACACLYLRRKKELLDTGVLGGHRKKRVGFFGWGKSGGSDISNLSSQALQGVQPVYDGIPGSTGYADGRWTESSAHSYSSHSPRPSSNGGYFPLERDELEVARTKLELEEARKREEIRLRNAPGSSSIVSYGPNPLTPSISPRPSTRFDTPTHTPISPLREPPVEGYYAPNAQKLSSARAQGRAPLVHRTGTVQSYSQTPAEYYAQGAQSSPPPILPPGPSDSYGPSISAQHPPRPAPPIVVSYGPNKITPTPAIAATPVGPPNNSSMTSQQHHDDAMTAFPVMDFPSYPFSSHESHAASDYGLDSMSQNAPPVALHPLPPYASVADHYAMEQGAIRKLAGPKATAELPPTKDGYYQDGDRTDEYELQGTGPRGEPQRRHEVGIGRNMDEQKFLLTGEDVRKWKEMKAKKRAEANGYEMQPAGSSSRQQQHKEN